MLVFICHLLSMVLLATEWASALLGSWLSNEQVIFHAAHGNYCATAASHTLDLQCFWNPQQLSKINEIQESRNGHFKLLVYVEYQLLPVFLF